MPEKPPIKPHLKQKPNFKKSDSGKELVLNRFTKIMSTPKSSSLKKLNIIGNLKRSNSATDSIF